MVLGKRILIAICCLAFVSMPARASNTFALPSPSGPAAIGAISLHLIDRSRWDPLAPVRVHRSLMVTLWYPARKSPATAAAYLDGGAARVVDNELDVPPGTFESFRSHAADAASIEAPGGHGYPVVIYSPGFGSWRNASTALTEELVSHGFVVVTIDHPYDGAAVEFPNRTIIKTRPLKAPTNTKILTYESWYAMVKPLLAVRVADVYFVVDELAALDAGRNPDAEGRHLPDHLAGALDLRRIGMLGHSLGGATAVQVLHSGTKIRAALSLDGPIPAATGTTCSVRPIMLIRSDDPALERLTIPSWKSASSSLCGWHVAVGLNGSGHNDFTDLTVFARQLGLSRRQRAAWALGSIYAREAVDVERNYVANFFERWLK